MKTKSAECILIALLCSMIACGGVVGGTTVEVPELGMAMKLPSGWVADRQNPRMFFEAANREDNFGMVEDYPLEGQSLSEYVEQMSKAGGGSVISKTPITISGHEAIELVTEAMYTVIEVDILKGESVVRVSFRALKEDYPEYETLFRSALRSIELR